MSQPTFPAINPEITREKALNMILASIAMEELGLSHIINAEGEKLQYILGTLEHQKEGCGGPCHSVDDILEINASIKSVLDSVMQNQIFLKDKMEKVLNADKGSSRPCPIGPPGPLGTPRRICVASFDAIKNSCWHEEHSLSLACTHTPIGCRNIELSKDKKEIVLKGKGHFLVNFALNVCPRQKCNGMISIALQSDDGRKKKTIFMFHMPITAAGFPVTISGGPIEVFALNDCKDTKLSLTLLQPCSLQVEEGFINITELTTGCER